MNEKAMERSTSNDARPVRGRSDVGDARSAHTPWGVWEVEVATDPDDGVPVYYVGIPDTRGRDGRDYRMGWAGLHKAKAWDPATACLLAAAPEMEWLLKRGLPLTCTNDPAADEWNRHARAVLAKIDAGLAPTAGVSSRTVPNDSERSQS